MAIASTARKVSSNPFIMSCYRALKVLSFGVFFLSSCSSAPVLPGTNSVNSRYTDEQPALSGDGRFLAFVSNREGRRTLLVYDLSLRQYVPLNRVNRNDTIAEHPSLSYTGRYLVYLASDYARPEVELYDRATGQVQVITQGYRGWVRSPRISSDGRFIAFESGSRGQWDIEIYDRGENVELDLPDGFRQPVNSPRN